MVWVILNIPAKRVHTFSKLMIGSKTAMADAAQILRQGSLLCLIRGAEEGLIIETLTPES